MENGLSTSTLSGLLEERGFTVASFAQAMSVSPSLAYKWIGAGNTVPPRYLREAIALLSLSDAERDDLIRLHAEYEMARGRPGQCASNEAA